jgi:uncharacterized BrkB/YihY/UPF0761 family membrane protein
MRYVASLLIGGAVAILAVASYIVISLATSYVGLGWGGAAYVDFGPMHLIITIVIFAVGFAASFPGIPRRPE